MLKYLRIAVTALSLAACVLLIALWVRSYWWTDSISGEWIAGRKEKWHVLDITSLGGFVAGWQHRTLFDEQGGDFDWSVGSVAFDTGQLGNVPWYGRFERHHQQTSNSIITEVIVPHWMLLLALVVLPWIRWSRRFSLRTLLIATTLVAVVLGIVFAAW